MKKNLSLSSPALSGMIAALYVLLTFLSHIFGLDSGIIQFRLSECLTVLPYFLPVAVPGVFVGCLLSNLLMGALPLDIILGSLATLLGALGTYWVGKKQLPLLLGMACPVLANTFIIPLVLSYVYHAEGVLWFFILTVFTGEAICICIGGGFLAKLWKKTLCRFFSS